MSLAAVARGAYDGYVRQFAQAAAALGRPILIRFAHEMNGGWVSYSERHSGNRPGDFVKAWRHVHDIFQREGATNVSWIWSPNIVPNGDRSLGELYPGDAYVDWVGLDGYSYPTEGCRPAERVFGPGLTEIARFSSRPVMLAEVAIASACPHESALITNLFAWLQTEPQVQSITWWERADRIHNWRVNSSQITEQAFRAGLKTHPVAGLSGLGSGSGSRSRRH